MASRPERQAVFEFSGNGAVLRLGCFALVLAMMMAWEFAAPLRRRRLARRTRWPHNLALTVVNTLCLKLLVPFAAMEAAVFASARDIGLFNLLGIGALPALAATVVLLDFAIYLRWPRKSQISALCLPFAGSL